MNKNLEHLDKKYKDEGSTAGQAFNPFLPLSEYVPDGEPHVFGDRVYIFGSHDKEGGETFCMLDYVTYSAPVTDLTDWRYEGVIYRADQDPQYGKDILWYNHVEENAAASAVTDSKNALKYMYAPDVTQGPDGRYYLYYCMSGDFGVGGYTCPISVAVADAPAGPYRFYGFVRTPDGNPMKRYVCFDPAVINDRGEIRLYYGTQYDFEERDDFTPDSDYLKQEVGMFGRTAEEILSYPDSIMGPVTVSLQPDMLTIKDQPRHIIPYRVKGTGFEGHPFFEAASIRRVGDKYYFIYSSQQNHELCYAVSDHPDRDFVFGGTIVSNGDVGFRGRTGQDRLNMTGTTHGSIEQINGEWYVFYHRLTHKSDYSRQACAEKIKIDDDGRIEQVEITSCGLNPGPLRGRGRYPAVICCNLTNGHMPHGSNRIYGDSFPNVTHGPAVKEGLKEREDDRTERIDRYIGEIGDGTLIGYKYFDFRGVSSLRLEYRIEGKGQGCFAVRLAPEGEDIAMIRTASEDEGETCPGMWQSGECRLSVPDGVYPIFLFYRGNAPASLLSLEFC